MHTQMQILINLFFASVHAFTHILMYLHAHIRIQTMKHLNRDS